MISLNAMNRVRERVALFAAANRAGLVPAQLEDLFTTPYLDPLKNLSTTLEKTAAKQVELYQKEYI